MAIIVSNINLECKLANKSQDWRRALICRNFVFTFLDTHSKQFITFSVALEINGTLSMEKNISPYGYNRYYHMVIFFHHMDFTIMVRLGKCIINYDEFASQNIIGINGIISFSIENHFWCTIDFQKMNCFEWSCSFQ